MIWLLLLLSGVKHGRNDWNYNDRLVSADCFFSLGNGCVIKAGRRENKRNDDGKGNKEWNP